MAEKLLVFGKCSWWNLSVYSKYLMIKKTNESAIVEPIHRRNRSMRPSLQLAQASTMVIDEVIRTAVFSVASGTLRISLESPPSGGQCGAWVRIISQLENRIASRI